MASKSKASSDKDLRDKGYLTPDEFIQILIPGLKSYLDSSWGFNRDIYHVEDLTSSAATYLEIATRVISDFGIDPTMIQTRLNRE